jgi:hypothetical protein
MLTMRTMCGAQQHEYEVTDPPPEADVSTPASASAANDVFIYPKQGQSEDQQAKDRYECHSWASNQTGFDPTQPLGGVAESEAGSKRSDYQRAMTAPGSAWIQREVRIRSAVFVCRGFQFRH